MKVDAKWVLLVLVVFGGLLFAQHWAGSQWRSKQGPDLLAQDHQGNLYIGLHSHIFRYSPSGKFLGQRDLMQLGIATRTGGIGFFPNGDLLMVPQNYQPSFLQQLLTSYRITSSVRTALSGQSGRLSRCEWETMRCTPLPGFTRQFGDAFWVDIDANENIFLADTSRHELLWLDKEGREIDRVVDRSALQFPNQIKRQNDVLWIANCNDNSLSSIGLNGNKFAQVFERYPLVDPRLAVADRWPIGIVLAGNDYVVLAKGSNLMHGSIVRMDANKVIADVFPKQVNANKPTEDFIALAWFNDEILAADFASLSIKRFSKYGAYKGDFDAPEFIAVAAGYRNQLIQYQMLERYFSWMFWSLLIVGFTLAVFLEKRHKAGKGEDGVIAEANPQVAPPLNDKRIQWLEYRFFWRNIHKWLFWFWAPMCILVFPTLFSAEEESFLRNAAFLLAHGVLLLELMHMQRLTSRKLGALVPWVLIKNGNLTQSVHEQNIYSFRWFGAVVLMLGREDILVIRRGNKPIFEGVLAQEYVQRLIGLAQPMTILARLQWLLDNKLAAMVWQLLLALVYILALLVPQLSLLQP